MFGLSLKKFHEKKKWTKTLAKYVINVNDVKKKSLEQRMSSQPYVNLRFKRPKFLSKYGFPKELREEFEKKPKFCNMSYLHNKNFNI